MRGESERNVESERKKNRIQNDLNCCDAIRLTRRKDKAKYQKDKY